MELPSNYLEEMKELLGDQYEAYLASFEQKTRLIKLMPKFQGLANEDPYKHTKEFSWVWLVKFLIMQLLKK